MRVILSGGGTGGHIYPAVTIAQALKKIDAKCEILFIGTTKGLEADIIPKEGFPLRTIEVRGLERKLSWRNMVTLAKTFGSVWQSRQIIRQFQPDLVIGTGGYVCGPVLLAASLMKIPTLIQEQNVVAGITNRILSRFVDMVAVGYSDAAKAFSGKGKAKVIVTGNPIRPEIMTAQREKALQDLELDPGKLTLLVSGGSRGARTINQAMLKVHDHFYNSDRLQILHVTGQSEYNSIVGNLEQAGIDLSQSGNIRIIPYLYSMPLALAVADMAIFRAGAIGLAELTARGIPAILIPYPYAAENHQEYNAKVLAREQAATVILDRELTSEKLIVQLEDWLEHAEKLTSMAEASRRLGRPEAAMSIAEQALALCKATTK